MKVVDCLPTGKRCPPLRIPISVEALWIARRSESRWSTSRKKIAFWSDGAEPITGNHRHEVVGRPCAGRTLSQCDRSNPCEACGSGWPAGAAIEAAKLSRIEGHLHHKRGPNSCPHLGSAGAG